MYIVLARKITNNDKKRAYWHWYCCYISGASNGFKTFRVFFNLLEDICAILLNPLCCFS
ncbi:hypothetical protein MKHDV_00509 [Halodesulfovibrio sp. MK-HDV]|jgi:hypothetical protein|nr:hypothetical protein MKHDV_00509 [Halodesulfovibrio sp. MK-HDV]